MFTSFLGSFLTLSRKKLQIVMQGSEAGSWSATCLAACVMLSQISAGPPLDRQPQSPAVSRRDAKSFQKALSETGQNDGGEDQPNQLLSNSQNTDATSTEQSLRKADRPAKNASKKDDSDRSDAAALAATPVDQSKPASLTGLLNLVSYQPADRSSSAAGKTDAADISGALSANADENKAAPAADASGGTAAAMSKTSKMNSPSTASTVAAATLVVAPIAVSEQNREAAKKLSSFVRDAEPSESTKSKAADRGQSMTVPLAYYPILLSGPGYPAGKSAPMSDSSSIAMSGVTGKTSSPNSALAAPSVQAGGKSEPLLLAEPTTAEALAPALSAKTLAFAMRLGSMVSQATAAGPEAVISSPSLSGLLENHIANIVNNPEEHGEKRQSNDSPAGNGSAFGSSYVDSSAGLRPAADKASFGDAASQANSTHGEELPGPAANTDPVRNVLLQLKADDNRRVDVRLVERGGELHVSVKSADPVLTQHLQDHMPELTSRLDEERLNHAVWMPRLAETNRSESRSNSSNSFTSGNSGGGSSENGDAGRRQNGNGHSRPDWVDLLENQLS